MTTPQYLPGEMLNLIAANVPQEVYVIINAFSPVRTRFWIPEDKDLMETIGTFSTLQLANDAAEAFVKHKVEPMLRTEGRPDPIETRKFKNGTMEWMVTERHCVCFVKTQKLTVRDQVWKKTEMPLPVHGDMRHNDKCLCCNTPDEIEAVKRAEAEAVQRSIRRDMKRRKIAIVKELEKLEQDEDLDAVDLEEKTEDEDESDHDEMEEDSEEESEEQNEDGDDD